MPTGVSLLTVRGRSSNAADGAEQSQQPTSHRIMGVPFEGADAPPPPPREGDATSSSSGSENEGAAAWELGVGSDSEPWEDPSAGGALALVLRAAEHGDAAVLAQLLPELDVSVDAPGPDSDRAIHLAALYGHAECARVLLAAGARADVADDDGSWPAHDAAAGGYFEILRLLLDAAPAGVGPADAEGDTPLHNAARGGSLEAARLLLERGANARAANAAGEAPAALAAPGSELRAALEAAAAEQAASAGDAGEGAAPS